MLLFDLPYLFSENYIYTILPRLLNLTLAGSIAMLAVLGIRWILRKTGARHRTVMLLWTVVLFRLLCPVSVPSPLSLFSLFETPVTDTGKLTFVSETIVYDEFPAVYLPSETLTEEINARLPQGREQVVGDPMEAPASSGAVLWMQGALIVACKGIVSAVLLRWKLREAVPEGGGVYVTDRIADPFVFGIWRARICLPAGLTEREKTLVLRHERTHVRRRDPLWKLLGYIACCVHWFNPLVWLAFFLAARDMELACDEAVTDGMSADERADYADVLLRLSTGRRLAFVTPVAFGENDCAVRIKQIIRRRETGTRVLILTWILAVLTLLLLGLNPVTETISTIPQSPTVSEVWYNFSGQEVPKTKIYVKNSTYDEKYPMAAQLDELWRRPNGEEVKIMDSYESAEYPGYVAVSFWYREGGLKGTRYNGYGVFYIDTEAGTTTLLETDMYMVNAIGEPTERIVSDCLLTAPAGFLLDESYVYLCSSLTPSGDPRAIRSEENPFVVTLLKNVVHDNRLTEDLTLVHTSDGVVQETIVPIRQSGEWLYVFKKTSGEDAVRLDAGDAD